MKPTNLDHHYPESTEYAPYYAGYIEKMPREGALAHFEQQIARLLEMFNGVTSEQGNYSYADGKWTIKQSIRHMADAERVFAYRLLCISRGDRTPLPGFDQDAYVVDTAVDHLSLTDLLQELSSARNSSIALISNLTEADWTRMGTASDNPVSARALFFIMGGHVEHHINLFNQRYLPGFS